MRIVFVFFFSSRRRHTRCSRDWSSDVCSSDLPVVLLDAVGEFGDLVVDGPALFHELADLLVGVHHRGVIPVAEQLRSEERRVGKECRSRWSPYHEKKKQAILQDSILDRRNDGT